MTDSIVAEITAISNYEDENYFGVCIGDPENNDNWFNAPNDIYTEDLEKGLTVDLDLLPGDQFIDVKQIDIIEEGSEAADSGENSDAGTGSGSSNAGNQTSSKNPKRANIQATAATKKAADIVQSQGDFTDEGEYIDKVSTVASGLNQIMDKLYEDNMQ